MKPSVAVGIGRRIRQTRTARGLSVAALAEHSDVSRRMLTQIELGQANPSVAILDRIAAGLQVTFAELVGVSASAPSDGVEVWSSAGGSWSYLLSAIDSATSSIELWKTHLTWGEGSDATGQTGSPDIAHHVLDGALEIIVASGDVHRVAEGEALRLSGEEDRRYQSAAATGTTFIRVVVMPRPDRPA